MKRGMAILVLVLSAGVAASPAWSQTDLGFRGAGFELDVVGPEELDTTIGFGAFADFGSVARNVRIEGYMGYWSKSEKAFDAETSASDVTLGGRGKYMFRVSNPRLLPFAGAGIGLHFVEVDVVVPDQDLGGIVIPGFVLEDSSTKLGLDFGGGLLYNLNGRTSLSSELWYSAVSDVNQLSLEIGVVWHFAAPSSTQQQQ